MQDPADKGVFGDYRTVREVGRGGMGIVFEAEHVETGGRFAVKVLPLGRSHDQKVVTRFRHEAETLKRLSHKNIVGVHDSGRDGDFYYFVMDFIEGRNLEDIVFKLKRSQRAVTRFVTSVSDSAKPAPKRRVQHHDTEYIETIVRLIADVADALAYAHDNELIHRDIKPSNLILAKGGRLILTDFGLVRDIRRRTFTITGEMIGTPLYMSPEQIAARRRGIDARTDTYSLGATLYEALTLNPPFDGEELPTLVKQIQFDEPESMRKSNAGVTSPLEAIVAQAMAKSPHSRYASMREFANDLRRYLAGQPVKARPPGRLARTWGRLRAHREAVVAIVAAIIIVVGVVGFSVFREVGNTRRTRSEVTRLLDEAELQIDTHAFSSAWRRCIEAEKEDPESERAVALKKRILDEALAAVKSNVEASDGSVSEAVRLATEMDRFAPQADESAEARSVAVRALEAAIASEVVAERDAMADDLVKRHEALSRASPNERSRLHSHVRDAVNVAIKKSWSDFEYGKTARHIKRLGRWGGKPDDDVPGINLLESMPYRSFETVARDIITSDINARRDGLKHLAFPRTFVQAPHGEVVRFLRLMLQESAYESVVAAVIETCAELRLAELADDVLRAVGRVPSALPAAVAALQKIPSDQSDQFLQETIAIDRGEVRNQAILALSAGASGANRVRLRRILTDPSEPLLARVLCALSLSHLGESEVAPIVMALARQTESRDHLRYLLSSLRRLGTPLELSDVEALLEAHAENDQVGVIAAQLLGLVGAPGLAIAREMAMSGIREPMKVAAVEAMAMIGTRSAMESLAKIMTDPSVATTVRTACALGIGQHQYLDGTNALTLVLERGPELVRQTAAVVLGGFVDARGSRQDEIVGALVQSFAAERGFVRVAAAESLRRLDAHWISKVFVDVVSAYEPQSDILKNILRLGPRDAKNPLENYATRYGPVSVLLPGLKGRFVESDDAVLAACRVLGHFAGLKGWSKNSRMQAVQALRGILAKPDAETATKQAAYDALGRCGPTVTADGMAAYVENEIDRAVRAAAALSLARLGAASTAHEHFVRQTDLTGRDCYRYACVWALDGDAARTAQWLIRAWLLGFDEWELIASEAVFDRVRDAGIVSRLLIQARHDSEMRRDIKG